MKEIQLNSNPIESDNVCSFIQSKISFGLLFNQWRIIDEAMGEYWNNRVIGSIICNEDNAEFIHKHCLKRKLLVPFERVLEITNFIWEYLESKNRLVDP